jgi:hypothetical protein
VARAFAACVNTSGEGEAPCLRCIQDYVPAFIGTCSQSELYTCSAIEACPACGNCQAEFATMSNCGNRNVCDTITCDDSGGPGPSPPSPASTPGGSPAAPAVSASTSSAARCGHPLATAVLAAAAAGAAVAAASGLV